MQVLLQFDDRAVAPLPDLFPAVRPLRHALADQDLRMNAGDQDFLVVGTIEYPDPPPGRQAPRGAPEKIMLQLVRAGLLETEDVHALGIDPRQDMADGAVFSRRIHGLKNEKQRKAVRRIKETLKFAQFGQVRPEDLL